jgi:hypothetical protein
MIAQPAIVPTVLGKNVFDRHLDAARNDRRVLIAGRFVDMPKTVPQMTSSSI